MRPPIEEWRLAYVKFGFPLLRYEIEFVTLCDYALALEAEKAELPTPLQFEHFYEYVKNLAAFEWTTKDCPFHPDLAKVMTWIFNQALKEEEP